MHLSAYWRRWTDWVLTTDKRQRIRLAMSGLAALLMVFCLVVMNSVAAAGLASTSEVRVWTACSVLGLIAVYAAIRSGWSRRFKDPALTLAQILYAITCCAAAFVIAGPARGVTLPILAIILMFGIFGLTTRQMLGVLVYSLVAFGLASGVVAGRDEPDYTPLWLLRLTWAWWSWCCSAAPSSPPACNPPASTCAARRPNWRGRWSKSASWPRTMT